MSCSNWSDITCITEPMFQLFKTTYYFISYSIWTFLFSLVIMVITAWALMDYPKFWEKSFWEKEK